MKWLAWGLAIGVLLLGAACHFLLPERYAVNAPLPHLLFGRGIDAPPETSLGTRIRAPEGLQISLFASELPNARWLHPTPAGDLLVSQPRAGRQYGGRVYNR